VELPVGVIVPALALGAGTNVNDAVSHDESFRNKTRRVTEDIVGKFLEVILGRALREDAGDVDGGGCLACPETMATPTRSLDPTFSSSFLLSQ
jgi:hypothetical protein